MRLLIVDNNLEVMSRLTRIIEWKMYGIKEVIQVKNCEEALQISEAFIPDIVVIDVQIIQVYGTKLKLELLRINPNCKLLVMVENMEIEALKVVIDIAAVAYFEKNMEVIEVIDSIDKAVSAVIESREQEQTLLDNIEYKKKELVRLLFRSTNANSMMALCQDVEFPIDDNHIHLACYLKSRDLQNNIAQDIKSIQVYFEKQGLYTLFGCVEQNCVPFVIIGEKLNEKYIKNVCRRFVSFHRKYIIAVGKGVSDVGDLYYSGKIAESALDKAYFKKEDCYFEVDQLCVQPNVEYIWYQEFVSQYRKNPYQLEAWYTERIEEFINCRRGSKERIISLTQAFTNLLLKEYPMLLEELVNFTDKDEIKYAMQKTENIDQLIEIFCDILEGLSSYLCHKKKFSKLVNEIMEFCYINISNSELNCQYISEHFLFTSTYLNILMKKEVGITMKQYVINMRIERAKNMLRNTFLDVNMISSVCGFSTRNNFTKSFKRKMGMTPSGFRDSYR